MIQFYPVGPPRVSDEPELVPVLLLPVADDGDVVVLGHGPGGVGEDAVWIESCYATEHPALNGSLTVLEHTKISKEQDGCTANSSGMICTCTVHTVLLMGVL